MINKAKNAIHQAVVPLIHAALPDAPIRKYGIHPLLWDILIAIGIPASRCGQSIGSAAASKGTHVKTGMYQGVDYSPCLDFRISDLSPADAMTYLLKPLAARGVCAFLRVPGQDGWPSTEAYHLHAIYPGCNLTPIVAHQVMDWLSLPTRTALVGHEVYKAYNASTGDREACKALFAEHKVVIL